MEGAGLERDELKIVDFCSGAGGPVPMIEMMVNEERGKAALKPIEFVMTDIQPHIPAWKEAILGRPSLRYIKDPVDATNPPSVVRAGKGQTRVIRTFYLAFHHFNDEMARKVLESTLETADAFVIIELQD